MSALFPRPNSVRWFAFGLVCLAALALLSGLVGTGFVVMAALFDLTLAGDTSLALMVGIIGLMGTMIGTVLPLLSAQSVWEARPSARVLVGVVGGALLLTPMLPVGAGLLMGVWGGGEVDRWLAHGRSLRLG